MERRVFALEQKLVHQIRYLRERLRADATIDPEYKTSTSSICGYYLSWRKSWESDGPGTMAGRQLEPASLTVLVPISIKNLPLHKGSCGICRDDYGTFYEDKKPEAPTRLPCGHIFGLECLVIWLTDHNSCPLCRRECS
jgi:hypothetical protein